MGATKKKKKPVGRPRRQARPNSNKGGRKKKLPGDHMSWNTKYLRAREYVEQVNDAHIIMIAAKLMKKKLDEVLGNDEETVYVLPEEDSIPSNETTLAYYLEFGLSKDAYVAIIEKFGSGYPAYRYVRKAKKDCEPNNCKVSEMEVLTPLQDMLNKTAERLIASVAQDWNQKHLANLRLIVTIGFDSPSGNKNSIQKCRDPENEFDDFRQSVLATSMTVIKLHCKQGDCVWLNPSPASHRFCRPLRVALEEDTPESYESEYERLSSEIDQLTPHEYTSSANKKVKIHFQVHQTMLEGVGNKELSTLPTDDMLLLLGLEMMHMEIRAFEYLLQLSYKIHLKTWTVTKDSEADVERMKRIVRTRFFDLFGMVPGEILRGYETMRTSNMARRCFREPRKFAAALELDADLISAIARVILLFKCKKTLKLDLLEQECWNIYWKHYELYPWAHLDETLHKVLTQGCQIARKALLPVAHFSEYGQESWHEYYWEDITEQYNKKSRLLRVYKQAIHESDPLISNILIKRRLKKQKKYQKEIPKDAEKFIAQPSAQPVSDESENESSEIDSDEGASSSESDF